MYPSNLQLVTCTLCLLLLHHHVSSLDQAQTEAQTSLFQNQIQLQLHALRQCEIPISDDDATAEAASCRVWTAADIACITTENTEQWGLLAETHTTNNRRRSTDTSIPQHLCTVAVKIIIYFGLAFDIKTNINLSFAALFYLCHDNNLIYILLKFLISFELLI